MNRRSTIRIAVLLGIGIGLLVHARPSYSEAMVQYFNTSWKELANKMPELAETGYNSIWVPPPTKGSGGLSVGYDHWDPFDLGGKDQRNTIRTRYGTEAELLHLMRIAHRFGIRIYFDTIMNHRAFDIPGFDESTPLDVYPGMRPEDFHLRVTEEGFYRKWDNTREWSDAWQVQNLGLADLIDIAHETPNTNFGPSEGDDHPKITFVRHPDNPEYYFDLDLPIGVTNPATMIGFDVHTFANKEPYDDAGYGIDDTGAGNGRFDWDDLDADGQHDSGETSEPFTDTGLDPTRPGWQTAVYGHGDGIYNMGNPVPEDVGGYLIRAVCWQMDYTHVDGLRLDAVKHVPDYFFGAYSDDVSDQGYLGGVQRQFNITRGFSDWDNHRDSVFDDLAPRDDAMAFGEHLGEPPGFEGYTAAGMRLVDNNLRSHLNNTLGNGYSGLWDLQHAGAKGFDARVSVSHAQSHDNDYAAVKELQHAFYFTRDNMPLIYTDGNYQSETLGESGGAFPRHANTAFLGQFGDNRIPNVVYLHNHFARGWQWGKLGDDDVAAFDRVDKHEDINMDDADAAVLSFMMNDNTADGSYRNVPTTFPNGAYLYNYADRFGRNDNGFYHTVQDGTISVTIPPGGYFAFSWRSPEESDLWAGPGGRAVTIYENGQETGYVSYERRDGPDGDPGFNPYGVADVATEDYAYDWYVPRVTSGNNLRFVARIDGSADNVLMKLDGGIDLNGGGRDNPPALSRDFKLGYEQMGFKQRQYREKFAARDTDLHNVIGSQGAETYTAVIGTGGFTIDTGATDRDSDVDTADRVYHDPGQDHTASGLPTTKQFDPEPGSAAGSDIDIWVKIHDGCQVNKAFIYYTTDGQSYPEGAGGEGIGSTKTVEMFFQAVDATLSQVDWWKGTIPALSGGTDLRYKIGAYKQQGGACEVGFEVVFPADYDAVQKKKSMLSVWEVTNFDATTVSYHPHMDYGPVETGLEDGFHILQARAFLQRPNRASIFNTFPQTFYLDLETPQGEIRYPAPTDSLFSQEYGSVIRTDRTVNDILVNIEDDDPANDDGQTGLNNGNGTNELGEVSWMPASSVQPSQSVDSDYPDEWRFTIRNIPSSGNVTMKARLMEISSSTNMALSDVDGHYNTLTRTIPASAPAQKLFFHWPAQDGEAVGAGWTIRIRYSKVLGGDPNDFLIKINDVTQGQSNYRIAYDVTAEYHELEYDLPILFNGDPDFLHHIEATHVTGGGVTLETHRFVKALPTQSGPFVDITNPPEFDSDGKAFEIILPDLAPGDLTEDDRRFTIQVETDLDAKKVWIEFETNGFAYGSAALIPSVETKLAGLVNVTMGDTQVTADKESLTGTVDATNGNSNIFGTGTAFEDELKLGQAICVHTNSLIVTQIVSQTHAVINTAYPGADTNQATAALRPTFLSDLSISDAIKIDDNDLTVAQVLSQSNLLLSATYPGTTGSGLDIFRIDESPAVVGSRKLWSFDWTNITEGAFRFYARMNTNDTSMSFVDATATRNTEVVFLEIVNANTNDFDDDDDGIWDNGETNPTNLPSSNPETWTNWEVKVWTAYGRSNPLRPDTDADGLPDGLELGFREIELDPTQTDTSEDTNGDGFPNFISDEDPPYFNTVPDSGHGFNRQLPGYDLTKSRTLKLIGTTTDPSNPDTDYDGIPDGVEDANHNGWIDGDGDRLPGNFMDPTFTDGAVDRNYPNGTIDTGETWQETDPNNSDSDTDGATDGYAEDWNFDGVIAGDTDGDRVYDGGETWSESDPLNPDTDGDGLPDGWENQYGFDALDNGTNSFRSGGAGDAINGAEGNPDNDFDEFAQPLTNLREFLSGTNPRVPDDVPPPPEGSILIGPNTNVITVGGVENAQIFTDWKLDDCLALDEYDGDGFNNQKGDIYLGWDGFDDSRDIVAFYARDGGSSIQQGTDKFYFRLDFHDLQANAEDGYLDIYIVIDTGEPGNGEMVLPDSVDTLTSNRWELVVASYGFNFGTVYADSNPGDNTDGFGQDLFSKGVQARPEYFAGSYYNAELDAVEIAIDRAALTGLPVPYSGNPSNLNYQVYVTKDGTENDPQGPGDIGGRSDIRDSIYDDNVAEDHFFSQGNVPTALSSWIPGWSKVGRVKVAQVIHGNQAIQPGNIIQDEINNGTGTGYYRPFDAHEAFGKPLNLHVTPTLASAIEWAAVDPAAGTPWRDGPSFNDRIGDLVDTGVIDLMGSTFSDHIMPYFTKAYNRDNVDLASEFLGEIYGADLDRDTAVFWSPERVFDDDVLQKIDDTGYQHTLVDQLLHMRKWFGRETALGSQGYKMNRIHNVNCFVINDQANVFRFDTNDNGLNMPLRRLMSRKARSGDQEQVVVFMSNWEEFGNSDQAAAYDTNLRWMANRPWIELVTLEQIANGEVDRDVPADGFGDPWTPVDRGAPTLAKIGHDFIHHASEEDYDSWYVGSDQEHGLQTNKFWIRTGVQMPDEYGMLYFGGVVKDAWDKVDAVANTNIGKLARGAMHASTFETAFHNNQNNDLSKFSTGDYIYPDSDTNTLASFSSDAQAQTRAASLFEHVDAWADNAWQGFYDGSTVATNEDVDLDGEVEYLLWNDRVLTVFERIGGRMVGAWTRDIFGTETYQAVGNQPGYAGSSTEEEGTQNVLPTGEVVAYRTSGLKDWYSTKDGGTAQYVNNLYTILMLSDGLQLTSSDNHIQKTVTLAPGSWQLEVHYALDAAETLFVRHGLSPNLYDLLLHGQENLTGEMHAGGLMMLANTNYEATVTTYIGYNDAGHNASFNLAAVDDDPVEAVEFSTLNMRNQAQTHQAEVSGTQNFSFSLGFQAVPSDWDGDGMPNVYEDGHPTFLDSTDPDDGDLDKDQDGMSNQQEYVADTNPDNITEYFSADELEAAGTGLAVRFEASKDREYRVFYCNDPVSDDMNWILATPTPLTTAVDGTIEWIDNGPPATSPHPSDPALDTRNYGIEVRMKQ